MTRRLTAGTVVRQSVPDGEPWSPYKPYITVDLRIAWPPQATDGQIEAALTAAEVDLRRRVHGMRDTESEPLEDLMRQEIREAMKQQGIRQGQGMSSDDEFAEFDTTEEEIDAMLAEGEPVDLVSQSGPENARSQD